LAIRPNFLAPADINEARLSPRPRSFLVESRQHGSGGISLRPVIGMAGTKAYRIAILLPSREAGGEPEYLIRSLLEGYEWVVKESKLIRLQRPQLNE